jgi:hypothetical protein
MLLIMDGFLVWIEIGISRCTLACVFGECVLLDVFWWERALWLFVNT